jgi:hypothetical protein
MTAATYTYDSKGHAIIPKGPNDVLDYPFDWTDWLASISDTIATSVSNVTDATSQAVVASESHTYTKAVVWVGGGIDGKTAAVTNRITTTGGRTAERTIYIKIQKGLSQ